MTDKPDNQNDKKVKVDKPEAAEAGPDQMSSSVEAILQARLKLEKEQAALDKMLKDKFQRNITVLFTDIKGSTAYFETYGDVEGRTMVQRHNAMLFPIIESHGGKVIKTIGDAIMATFDEPAKGVHSAIQMQKALEEHNKVQDQKHRRILVRMGLNFGPAVIEDKDVFGDAVNVAARVESQADAEQIMISDDLYKEVRGDDEILVRFFGEATVKGKAEPVKIYRVVWSEEQMASEGEFKKAATRRTVDKRGRTVRGRVIEFSASREGGKMKISVFEHARGEERTVSQYDVVKLDENLVKTQCDEVVGLLNRANKRGKITKEILKQLQGAGQILFDHLLTSEAKQKIMSSQAEHLIIRMDDRLVHVPWELLFDGKQFFCQRFSMGRIVATRQKITDSAERHIARPLRMLVVADPRSDLPASRAEGTQIRDELDKEHEFINVNLKASEVPVNFLKNKIRDYDVIHYAGHADYDKSDPGNSGWLLADGKLSSNEIKNMTGKKPMPALVFANACQSGQTEEWKIESGYEQDIFGLANAFLVSGVQHYVGTFWDILDDPGRDFAAAFYRETLTGCSVGEAVRRARLSLIDKYGEDTIVWASYMLYGDPTFSYLEDVAQAEEADAEQVAATIMSPGSGQPLTQPGQPAMFRGAGAAASTTAGMSKGMMAIFGALIVIVGIIAVAVLMNSRGPKQTEAPIVVNKGDRAASDKLIAEGLALSQKGDREAAIAAYQKALDADPSNSQAAVNLGQSYLAMGKVAEAKEAFAQAKKAEPGNDVASMLLAQTVNNMKLQADADKSAEVNRLARELADQYRSGNIPAPKNAGDDWTSRPIVITLLDFEQKGKLQMEGEFDFIKMAITQYLNDDPRVEVVEREKIDRVLQELNLAGGALADENTRLRLGKIFGARLIATGTFARFGTEAQVNLRLIETETTQLKVSVSPIFKGAKSPSEIARGLADEMIKEIYAEFPLQALITEVKGDQVTINIGANVKLKKGLKMDILDNDLMKTGSIEIIDVGANKAKAKIVEKPEGKLMPGMKVREVSE